MKALTRSTARGLPLFAEICSVQGVRTATCDAADQNFLTEVLYRKMELDSVLNNDLAAAISATKYEEADENELDLDLHDPALAVNTSSAGSAGSAQRMSKYWESDGAVFDRRRTVRDAQQLS